ncbi:exopolysaccharide biosynthesis polyprenyl glycosylphosphotransferase [Microbacteriaceae bacterium SG_E_30_P1]|uniref:Exopolysaccharide biosynthesis polyprenyl glycosylphosphotransferase n=1 Tax=Antiquaquibacter oligotrophicus TaxID=2880260 RepID=A0ABT6KNX0_9MICO|nr:sugar transferase [Antiquaquibacter oligotrophicus]MDH6181695.1 exopolysaccharide biosynthesis polyprenyl glycosylphosphotransferase [Antiquaquibacter oligotrophicus]UDF12621.1 sugar transferase [Antiquaquibacter oligotrophicus]
MVHPRATERPARAQWVRMYTRQLFLTDALAVLVAVGGSHLLWFGTRSVELASGDLLPLGISYLVVSVVLAASWLIFLHVFGTRDARIVGSGLQEYARTADATVRLFGLVAIVSLLLMIDIARGFIITAFPVGLFLILLGRWLWRQWLREKRFTGLYRVRLIVVGSTGSITELADELRRHAYAGFEVVGVCLTVPTESPDDVAKLGVPVFRSISDLTAIIRQTDAHVVALAGSHGLTPSAVRSISWQLERTGIDLMVAPSITDIAGTRIHTRLVAGLPLIYVESPSYEGGAKVIKALFDFTAAIILTILLSPVLIAIAIAVKVTSRGPVFFTQERVGLGGSLFRIIKFRSMTVGADEELMSLLAEKDLDTQPLFKIRDDPRVTRLGKFLRSTSLDELPQLFNVIKGDMSLVGPRPQIAAEVALYTDDAARRLLVKPGITGLWQISGRSDLGWEEAVKLDLYYVENWSLTDDLVILFRTARAVLLRVGAH